MGLFDRLWRGRGGGRNHPDEADAINSYLSGTGRDLSQLESHDQPVKIHVSAPVRQALEELANYHESNLSTLVRHVLFVHLYGAYDLQARAERGNESFMPYKAKAFDIGISEARRKPPPESEAAAPLGKNQENVKVFLPQKMVSDLDALARQEPLSRSEYIREALVRYLFGRVQQPGL